MATDSPSPDTKPNRSKIARLFRWCFSWRGFRAFFVTILVLSTLWGLFCAIENYRGNRAWLQTKSSLESRGEKLTSKDFIPPEIPDDQNMAATPLLKVLLDWTPGPNAHPKNQAVYDEAKQIGTSLPGGHPTPAWSRGEKTDFDAIRQSLSKDKSLTVNTNGTNIATDVLNAMQPWNKAFAEVREAAKRPHARFSINWGAGAETLLPHLSVLKSISLSLAVRSAAQLELNQTDEAFQDVITAFRVGDAAGSDSFLIGFLVQLAIDKIIFQPVWEGIQGHKWSDAQLALVQAKIASRDYIALGKRALRVERAVLANTELDRITLHPERATQVFDGPPESGNQVPIGSLFTATPRGWIRQNQALINRAFQDYIDSVPDKREELHRLDGDAVEAKIFGSFTTFFPYSAMARMLMPALMKSFQTATQSEAYRSIALVGCAFERHKIKHGNYPESLEKLDPALLPSSALDPYTGKLLRMVRNKDGSLALYSVGPDRKDDGGTPLAKGKGDIVWMLPNR